MGYQKSPERKPGLFFHVDFNAFFCRCEVTVIIRQYSVALVVNSRMQFKNGSF